MRLTGTLFFVFISTLTAEIPFDFLANYCMECHDDDVQKGEINFENPPENWSEHDTYLFWKRAKQAILDHEMPPKKEKHQPTLSARHKVVAKLNKEMAAFSPIGGTVFHRLNKRQYLNTVRKVFKYNHQLSPTFPDDSVHHGFDTTAKDLILSTPLMIEYLNSANDIVEACFSIDQPLPKATPRIIKVPATSFSSSFQGSKVQTYRDTQRMRLSCSNEVLIRSCTWPSTFEANQTGLYEVEIDLSAYKPKIDQSMEVKLYKITSGASFVNLKTLKVLAEFTVRGEEVSKHRATIRLNRGESFAVYWSNSRIGGFDKNGHPLDEKLQFEEILSEGNNLAAWLKVDQQRGLPPADAWQMMKEALQDKNLKRVPLNKIPNLGSVVLRNSFFQVCQNMVHDFGPALDVHGVKVKGPIEVYKDPKEVEKQHRKKMLIGERKDRSDRQWLEDVLQPMLTNLFRKPISQDLLKKYVDFAEAEVLETNKIERGFQKAMRAALISPDFLYHVKKEGTLDDFDLASRLSYFLSSSPPDGKLFRLAMEGTLRKGDNLLKETKRLLRHSKSKSFVTDFTSQWLETRKLDDIMPDSRLIPKFFTADRISMKTEVEQSFQEILSNNLTLDQFIAPDFAFTNDILSRRIYDYPYDKKKKVKYNTPKIPKLEKIKIDPFGKYGGVLGFAGVMMATANGVDTEPVHRGVWVLENILGMPPPPPPKSVPAIAPNTADAKSLRDRLMAHRDSPQCASCHQKIDPIGFVLEHYDPIGRWRDHYPVYSKDAKGRFVTTAGLKVDSAGQMPTGYSLNSPADLKKYLCDNLELFGNCLSKKLLSYATGRYLSYGDEQEMELIVKDLLQKKEGFEDLIVKIVQSKAFQTK